ncbi:MAG: pyruvate kinase, partial [Bacilli bacterium]
MKKTKIICTLGPASRDEIVLEKMVKYGMNVARLNFSHGTHEYHKESIELVKKVREKLHVPLAIMLDTKGPEIRLGDFEKESIYLKKGDRFTLTTKPIMGNNEIVEITYKDLPSQITVGNKILIDDGKVTLEVVATNDTDIICKVINGGALSNHKGVNIPNVHLNFEYLSPKDKEDLKFGVDNDVDFIAASFVRSKEDVIQL